MKLKRWLVGLLLPLTLFVTSPNFAGDISDDPWIALAIEEIERTYGDTCYVGRKSLRKYGSDSDLDTADGLLEINGLGNNETYLTDNLITHFSSASGSDTGSLYLEGMVLNSDGNLVFTTQTVTLAGQTKTALTTPLARATRGRYLGATPSVGNIWVYEDAAVTAGVPDDINDAHLTLPAGKNTSLKASTSVAYTNYLILTYWRTNVGKTTSTSIDLELRSRVLNNAFISIDDSAATNSQPHNQTNPPYRIIPPNSDLVVVASTAANNTVVVSSFGGVFCDIQGVADNAANDPVLTEDGWVVPNR